MKQKSKGEDGNVNTTLQNVTLRVGKSKTAQFVKRGVQIRR